MRATIILSMSLGMILATLQPLYAQSSRGSAEAGRLYALNWCTGCHSVEPATDGLGRSAPDFTAVAKSPSTTTSSLKGFFRSDHDRMPTFVLNTTEVDDVAAYILSLRRR